MWECFLRSIPLLRPLKLPHSVTPLSRFALPFNSGATLTLLLEITALAPWFCEFCADGFFEKIGFECIECLLMIHFSASFHFDGTCRTNSAGIKCWPGDLSSLWNSKFEFSEPFVLFSSCLEASELAVFAAEPTFDVLNCPENNKRKKDQSLH